MAQDSDSKALATPVAVGGGTKGLAAADWRQGLQLADGRRGGCQQHCIDTPNDSCLRLTQPQALHI